MKKLILTSKHYEGEVHITYDMNLNLKRIDFTHAQLDKKQIVYMKGLTPPTYKDDEFIKAYQTDTLRYIEEDVEIDFEKHFWNAYDKKINKGRVIKLFDKLSKSDQYEAIAGIQRYNRHLQLNRWQTKLDPENYIKNRTWENEWT